MLEIAGTMRILVVTVQQGHARKCAIAIIAMVLLDETMRLHVSSQIGPIGKSSEAYLAFEWLLARMSSVVALQEPRPRERFAAYLALAR